MPEVLKVYSDAFEVIGSPFGVTLKFKRRAAVPSPTPPPPEDLIEISMSWEHLKAMTYILWRYIKEIENAGGVFYSLPTKVLNDLRIALEDWEAFWKSPK